MSQQIASSGDLENRATLRVIQAEEKVPSVTLDNMVFTSRWDFIKKHFKEHWDLLDSPIKGKKLPYGLEEVQFIITYAMIAPLTFVVAIRYDNQKKGYVLR